MLRVSGYGQTGPYRDRPGFDVIGEAMGGLRHLSGEPGRTPVRVGVGVSIGDSLSALHGVIGVLLALAFEVELSRFCLDTLPTVATAVNLHTMLGFAPTDAYVFDPIPDASFLALELC